MTYRAATQGFSPTDKDKKPVVRILFCIFITFLSVGFTLILCCFTFLSTFLIDSDLVLLTCLFVLQYPSVILESLSVLVTYLTFCLFLLSSRLFVIPACLFICLFYLLVYLLVNCLANFVILMLISLSCIYT